MLFHSLARRKHRKILAVFSLWIGLSLATMLLMLSIDVGDKINLELRSFGANVKVEPKEYLFPEIIGRQVATGSDQSGYLNESDVIRLKEIFWSNNILGFVARLKTRAMIKEGEVPLLGLLFDQLIPLEGKEIFRTGARHVYKHWGIEGRWPQNDEECLIGEDLAKQMKIAVGNRIQVQGKVGGTVFNVTGIVSTGEWEDRAIIASLKKVQEISDLSGKITDIDVNALTTPENKLAEKYKKDPKTLTSAEYERWYCTPYPGSVAAQIQEGIPGSVARVVRRISETQGVLFTRIEGLVGWLGFLAVASCALSLIGVFSSAILARRTEVAILQAIGATRGNVLAIFLTENTLIGIIGGFLASISGFQGGRWLIHFIFNSSSNVSFAAPLIITVLLGIFIAWAGSLWPTRQMLDQNIVKTLHGT